MTTSYAVFIAVGWAVVLYATWPEHTGIAGYLGRYWYWAELVLWLVMAPVTVLAAWLRWRRVIQLVGTLAMVGGAFALTMLPLSPRMSLTDGRAWFEDHRSDYKDGAARAIEDGCCGGDLYGELLPEDLRWLTAMGKVSGDRDALFFPQWYGIPDDSGGYWHLPGGDSPAGLDMAGMECVDPVDLGEGWWMCGMEV